MCAPHHAPHPPERQALIASEYDANTAADTPTYPFSAIVCMNLPRYAPHVRGLRRHPV